MNGKYAESKSEVSRASESECGPLFEALNDALIPPICYTSPSANALQNKEITATYSPVSFKEETTNNHGREST